MPRLSSTNPNPTASNVSSPAGNLVPPSKPTAVQTRRQADTAAGLAMKVGLDHPAYNTPLKRPGYNCKPLTALGYAHFSLADAAKALLATRPGWSKEDHHRLALAHQSLAEGHRKAWGVVADEAAQATFGRNFEFADYKVSGVGRDEFPIEFKDKLRTHAHSETKHKDLARVHEHIARYGRNLG